jgi:hypothetical protein
MGRKKIYENEEAKKLAHKEYQRLYRERNKNDEAYKAKEKEHQKLYRERHKNDEAYKAKRREHNKKYQTPEYRAAYIEKNKERIIEQQKRYREKNYKNSSLLKKLVKRMPGILETIRTNDELNAMLDLS